MNYGNVMIIGALKLILSWTGEHFFLNQTYLSTVVYVDTYKKEH